MTTSSTQESVQRDLVAAVSSFPSSSSGYSYAPTTTAALPSQIQHTSADPGTSQWVETEAPTRPRIPQPWPTFSGVPSDSRPSHGFNFVVPLEDSAQSYNSGPLSDSSPWAFQAKPFPAVLESMKSRNNPLSTKATDSMGHVQSPLALGVMYPGLLPENTLASCDDTDRQFGGRLAPLIEPQKTSQAPDNGSTYQIPSFEHTYANSSIGTTHRRSASPVTHLSDVPSLEEHTTSSDLDASRHHTPSHDGISQVVSNQQSSPQWQRSRASSLRRPSPSPRAYSRGHSHPSESGRPHRNSISSFVSTPPPPPPPSHPPSQSSPYTSASQETTAAQASRFCSPATPLSLPAVTPPSFSAQREFKLQPLVLSQPYDYPQHTSADLYFTADTIGKYVSPPMTSMSMPPTFAEHHFHHQSQQSLQATPRMPSDSPDLFASARHEQLEPPLEDLFPSDPALMPREQDTRSEGDLYTPRWVRGHGHKREGWCGMCRPGRWLILKNSAYWYDKSFSHGICASSGELFAGPGTFRRSVDNHEIWEGYCGTCDQWISLINSKRTGTSWFRHVAKCHSKPKDNTSAKRRRMSGSFRPLSTPSSLAYISAMPLPSSGPSYQPLTESSSFMRINQNRPTSGIL